MLPKISPFGTAINPEIYISYANLNHEVLNKPLADYVKDEYGWTMLQFSAICYIKRYERLSMSRLADLLSITRQQTTQLVESLAKKQLVTREHEPDNRRMVYVRATELAIEQLLSAEAVFSERVRSFISTLPEETQAKVNDAISTMTEILRAYVEGKESIMNSHR